MMPLPSNDALLALLDFKNILETATGNVFVAQNIVAITSAGIVQPNAAQALQPNFQNQVPRVELMVTIGAGKKQVFAIVNGVKFNCSYEAALKVRAITRTDAEDKSVHADFRSSVFYIANMLSAFTNGQGSVGGLARHQIHSPITQTGTDDVFKTADGFEYSDQNFSFDFTVNPRFVEDCLQMPAPNPNPNP